MMIDKINNQNISIDNNISDTYLDGSYLENNKTWHLEDSVWKCEHILNLLSKNTINPTTVGEVGCGAGEILNQLSLALKDSEFHGYEISPEAFKLCKSKESRRVHFEFGDILKRNVYYDVLLCIDVFEHVQDYMGFISALKSKGKFKIFHIPLDISVSSILFGSMINARKNIGHLHYFTPATAIATLEDCGYSIVDSFYTTGFSRPSRSRKLRSIIARLPRKILFSISQDFMVKILGGCSLIVLVE